MAPVPLLSALAPPLCWACGASADARRPLCRGCRAQLQWAQPALLEASGVPCWAPVLYRGPARALVGGLKFRGAHGLARDLAAAIAAGAPDGLLDGALVPVPLSASRRRTRGFNQAERLAAALGERTAVPVSDVLRRHGRPGPQSLLGSVSDWPRRRPR